MVVFEVVWGCFLLFFLEDFGGVCFRAVLSGSVWFSGEFSFFFDFLSGVFFFMLFCCGVGALLFCVHYFSGEGWKGLFGLMLLFLGVMVLLVFSSGVFSSLIFWEYLGLVSFLLILFYSNMCSFRAAVITLVSSRFGDVGLFLILCWLWYDQGVLSGLAGVLVFFVIMTKSAGYPFISWLVEAMRAPTPVSSLVHSSTLVAAGAWFLLRYSDFFDVVAFWLIFFSSSISIIFSAICACCVMDIKKVVAYSTCNNISWCLLYFICGDVVLSACQLLIHGLCKSLLFMCVGDLMVSSGSSQSGVNIFSSPRLSWLSCFLCVFLVCCLCGLPFLGVFFTKHVFLSNCFFSVGVFNFWFLVFGFFLSHVYSFRFVTLLFSEGGGLNGNYLSCFTAISGFVYVIYGFGLVLDGLLEEVVTSGFMWGCLLLFVQCLGCLFGVFVWSYDIQNPYFVSRIFGCDSFVVGLFFSYFSFRDLLSFWLFRWEAVVFKWVIGVDLRSSRFYGLGLNGVLLVAGVAFVFYLVVLFS